MGNEYLNGMPCHKYILRNLNSEQDYKEFSAQFYNVLFEKVGCTPDEIVTALSMLSITCPDANYQFDNWEGVTITEKNIASIFSDIKVLSCEDYLQSKLNDISVCATCPFNKGCYNKMKESESVLLNYALFSKENLDYLRGKGVSSEYFRYNVDLTENVRDSKRPMVTSIYFIVFSALLSQSQFRDSIYNSKSVDEKYTGLSRYLHNFFSLYTEISIHKFMDVAAHNLFDLNTEISVSDVDNSIVYIENMYKLKKETPKKKPGRKKKVKEETLDFVPIFDDSDIPNVTDNSSDELLDILNFDSSDNSSNASVFDLYGDDFWSKFSQSENNVKESDSEDTNENNDEFLSDQSTSDIIIEDLPSPAAKEENDSFQLSNDDYWEAMEMLAKTSASVPDPVMDYVPEDYIPVDFEQEDFVSIAEPDNIPNGFEINEEEFHVEEPPIPDIPSEYFDENLLFAHKANDEIDNNVSSEERIIEGKASQSEPIEEQVSSDDKLNKEVNDDEHPSEPHPFIENMDTIDGSPENNSVAENEIHPETNEETPAEHEEQTNDTEQSGLPFTNNSITYVSMSDDDEDLLSLPSISFMELNSFAIKLDSMNHMERTAVATALFRDKKLSCEVCYCLELQQPILVMFVYSLRCYFWSDMRDKEKLSPIIKDAFSWKSISLYCYNPYSLISYMRIFGWKVRGVVSLFLLSTVLYPENRYDYEQNMAVLKAKPIIPGVNIKIRKKPQSLALKYISSYFYAYRRNEDHIKSGNMYTLNEITNLAFSMAPSYFYKFVTDDFGWRVSFSMHLAGKYNCLNLMPDKLLSYGCVMNFTYSDPYGDYLKASPDIPVTTRVIKKLYEDEQFVRSNLFIISMDSITLTAFIGENEKQMVASRIINSFGAVFSDLRLSMVDWEWEVVCEYSSESDYLIPVNIS